MWFPVNSNQGQSELIPACEKPCVHAYPWSPLSQQKDWSSWFVGICLYIAVHIKHCWAQSMSACLSAGSSHGVALHAGLLLCGAAHRSIRSGFRRDTKHQLETGKVSNIWPSVQSPNRLHVCHHLWGRSGRWLERGYSALICPETDSFWFCCCHRCLAVQ